MTYRLHAESRARELDTPRGSAGIYRYGACARAERRGRIVPVDALSIITRGQDPLTKELADDPGFSSVIRMRAPARRCAAVAFAAAVAASEIVNLTDVTFVTRAWMCMGYDMFCGSCIWSWLLQGIDRWAISIRCGDLI